MTKYVPVAGTNAGMQEHAWNREGSLFALFMRDHGFEWCGAAFGFWSTALAGTFFTGSGHLAWQFGAKQLQAHVNALAYEDRNIWAHSWGGAVVAYLLADPKTERVRSVVTIDTPLQRRLDPVWYAGKHNRDYHEHLFSKGWGSRIRFLAQRGRPMRAMPWADRNTNITGGHSGMLNRQAFMPQAAPVGHRVRTLDRKAA